MPHHNNYYALNHCQILYTAAEINAGGLSAAGTITQLGFYITTSPSNALPNYTIRIKNTTATDAASYDGSGLTQVYTTASYAPVQGGDELLTINTPFVWDGVSNILLDVCSGLAASSSGKVSTFAPVPAGAERFGCGQFLYLEFRRRHSNHICNSPDAQHFAGYCIHLYCNGY